MAGLNTLCGAPSRFDLGFLAEALVQTIADLKLQLCRRRRIIAVEAPKYAIQERRQGRQCQKPGVVQLSDQLAQEARRLVWLIRTLAGEEIGERLEEEIDRQLVAERRIDDLPRSFLGGHELVALLEARRRPSPGFAHKPCPL